MYRAVDHDGNTIDFMLSNHKNLPEAKRFLMQLLSRSHVKKSPKYIVTDKNPAYPSAVKNLKASGFLSCRTQWAFVNYGNNILEQDHRFTKSRSKYGMWYQSFKSAQNTIDGYEAMHMIEKGQVRHVPKNDPRSQCRFIQKLFQEVA